MEEKDKNSFFKFLEGLLRDQPYVNLAYMAGVFSIAKYFNSSELNMFDEYNFINDNIYDRYFGFSKEDVGVRSARLYSLKDGMTDTISMTEEAFLNQAL